MKYKIGQIVTVDHPYYAGPVKMKITGFDGPRNSDEITSITCDVADDGYPKGNYIFDSPRYPG